MQFMKKTADQTQSDQNRFDIANSLMNGILMQ